MTRKIVNVVGQIARGLTRKLEIAYPDAAVDWGYAPDYVDAMRRILRLDEPGDYVIATGVPHTVREFCDVAFRTAGLDYRDHLISPLGREVRARPLLT